MVIMGIILVLMGNYNGVYWYVMDLLWDVKSYWKNAQNTLQKRNFVMVLLEKANGS